MEFWSNMDPFSWNLDLSLAKIQVEINFLSTINMKSNPNKSTDRDILNRILEIVEKQSNHIAQESRKQIYDNKAIMALLNIKDKYLKKLRDNGYLGYSRAGDKYWDTQEDVDRFLQRFHFSDFTSHSDLPPP